MEMQAKEYFMNDKFYSALLLYSKLDSIKEGNTDYIYPLGVCYFLNGKTDKALSYFESCLLHPEKYPPALNYYVAKSYHLKNKFDDAIKYYIAYKQHLQRKKRKNYKLIYDTDRDIQMCKNAKEYILKPLDIEIVNLGNIINSPYPDYGPVMSADDSTLIFTSCRPNTTGREIDEYDGKYFEDIYISHLTSSGMWTSPVHVSENINTTRHDASIALTPDGQKLLFYRSGKENMLDRSSGDLYLSELKGRDWMPPVKYHAIINSKDWEPSGCLSADERMLYFTSDREGGFGGTDIYCVKRSADGMWSEPVNMGNKINTPYDEDSPFIHPDGKTIYFSSNSYNSMGGFDIFFSKYNSEKEEWSDPENLGYPINTAHDDIHFSLSADGKKVYFSSIRPEGNGDKDIYFADLRKAGAEVLVLTGLVMDSITKEPIETTIKLTDAITNEVLGVFNSNSASGKYIMVVVEGKNYNVSVESEEYELCTQNINISNLHSFEILHKDFQLCRKKK